MVSKYEPLADEPLAEYPTVQVDDRVTLLFVQIEALLARRRPGVMDLLPAGAYGRVWWEAAATPQTQAWLQVRWQVGAVDVPRRSVTFVRVAADTPPTPAEPLR